MLQRARSYSANDRGGVDPRLVPFRDLSDRDSFPFLPNILVYLHRVYGLGQLYSTWSCFISQLFPGPMGLLSQARCYRWASPPALY